MPEPTGVLGEKKYGYGPGRLYWDTETGGDNIDLGPTNGITWEMIHNWLGLRSADAGDKDDESAVTASDWIITTGLAKPGYETLVRMMPGFEATRDSGTNDIVSVSGIQARGWNTEDHRVQVTFKEYDRETNAITTNPWRIVDFWAVAPMPETLSLNWNATEQRYFQIRLHARESELHTAPSGAYEAWKIRGGAS